METLKTATFFVFVLLLLAIAGHMDDEDAALLASADRPSINPPHVVNSSIGGGKSCK